MRTNTCEVGVSESYCLWSALLVPVTKLKFISKALAEAVTFSVTYEFHSLQRIVGETLGCENYFYSWKSISYYSATRTFQVLVWVDLCLFCKPCAPVGISRSLEPFTLLQSYTPVWYFSLVVVQPNTSKNGTLPQKNYSCATNCTHFILFLPHKQNIVAAVQILLKIILGNLGNFCWLNFKIVKAKCWKSQKFGFITIGNLRKYGT